eukprot:CAMPEP_0197238276 /NCGR_PEP_ID=MMETSP1429-20130617/4800_1 /TAXON_ID=49237 /ORGANISM="Chaetoceros  sp., Strain UNC1202" /LENGTH=126 /DNA_ID=CAMNT_0042697393 /DNA_START=298 /DNA_END=679 /DNA_ORIENTATION=-
MRISIDATLSIGIFLFERIERELSGTPPRSIDGRDGMIPSVHSALPDLFAFLVEESTSEIRVVFGFMVGVRTGIEVWENMSPPKPVLQGSVTARAAAMARAASAAFPPLTRVWRPMEEASGCYMNQ